MTQLKVLTPPPSPAKTIMSNESNVLFTIEIPKSDGDKKGHHHSHTISILTVDDSIFEELLGDSSSSSSGSMQFDDDANMPALQESSSSSFPTLPSTCPLLVDQGLIRPVRQKSILQDVSQHVFSQEEEDDELYHSCGSHFTQPHKVAPGSIIASSSSSTRSFELIFRSTTNVQDIFDLVFNTDAGGPPKITSVDITKLEQPVPSPPRFRMSDPALLSSENSTSANPPQCLHPPQHDGSSSSSSSSSNNNNNQLIRHDQGDQSHWNPSPSPNTVQTIGPDREALAGDHNHAPALLTIPSLSREWPCSSDDDCGWSLDTTLKQMLRLDHNDHHHHHPRRNRNTTSFPDLPWFDVPSMSSLSSHSPFLSSCQLTDPINEDEDNDDEDDDEQCGTTLSGNQMIRSNHNNHNHNDLGAPKDQIRTDSSNDDDGDDDAHGKDAPPTRMMIGTINDHVLVQPTNVLSRMQTPLDGRRRRRGDIPPRFPRRSASRLDWRSVEFTMCSLPSLPEESLTEKHDDNDDDHHADNDHNRNDNNDPLLA